MQNLETIRAGGWCWHFAKTKTVLVKYKSGKWMHFFTDQKFAWEICEKAIAEGICSECKCTDMKMTDYKTGVICFYTNYDDVDGHCRILQFMLKNNLIPKNKNGRLYNISFKFDDQTRAGEYGAGFVGHIKLEHFVDLNTGEFLPNMNPAGD